MAREMIPQERAAVYKYHRVFDGYNFLSGPKGMEEIVTHDMELVSMEDHEAALQETRRAALLEARQAVLGERLSATEIYCSEDEVYNDAIDDALGAIDRLAQEG